MILKKYSSLIILLTIALYGISQNSNLQIRDIIKQIDYDFDSISALTYNSITSDLTANNKKDVFTITENEFLEKYPEIFKILDSCYYFKTIDGQNYKICKPDSTLFDQEESVNKEHLFYYFRGQYCNYALIEMAGYEFWGYLTIDLSDGNVYYTMRKPISYNCDVIVSYANYYGEEEISIIDTKSKKQLVIGIEGWYTIDFKMNENDFYFKLKEGDEFKYIKIKIK